MAEWSTRGKSEDSIFKTGYCPEAGIKIRKTAKEILAEPFREPAQARRADRITVHIAKMV